MRRLLWTFVILSPLLALAQNDQAALAPRHAAHLARTITVQATENVAAVMHVIQTLLT
jgi:hypothetical protein